MDVESRFKALSKQLFSQRSVGDPLDGGTDFQRLVLGAPSRTGSAAGDGTELAEWLLSSHVDRGFDHARLAETLRQASFLQAPGLFLAAAKDCRELAALNRADAPVFAGSAAIFVFVAAALGDQEAARCVAAEAIAVAEADAVSEDQRLALQAAALGWLSYAALPATSMPRDPRQYAREAAERSLDGMARAWKGALLNRKSMLTTYPFSDGEEAPLFREFEEQQDDADIQEPGSVVVLRSIGGTETPEGGRLAKAYRGLVGQPLPLVRTPDLAAVRRKLTAGYPHARETIDAILGELVGHEFVRLPPMIFLGPPGAGKTAFCSSLLEALDVPSTLYPCGGVSDSAFGGTSRRWQTGGPCTPVSVMSARQVASPGIVLDELEKAADSVHNGRIQDVLLGMLEPASAACWQDPYLQADVDLSHVVWLATANSLAGLPTPLLDRCRVLRLPVPGPEHLPVLAATLLRRACAARNLDERWARSLDGVEMEAVAAAWRGGSIRRLARLLDGVLAARDHVPCLH